MLLELKDVNVFYGSIHALKGISLHVDEGEIVTLIGSNGAGKSTTLNSIIGIVHAKSGSIRFRDQEIMGRGSHDIVSMGIGYAPEGRDVCPKLSVYENLEIGFYTRKDKEEFKKNLAYVYQMFPLLEERRHQTAGTLSGGEQQMLAIGRALMSSPKLLMLDEPSLGLAPALVKQLFHQIVEIRKSGVTILLIEQNARMALKIADRGYVLETGTISLEDRAENLLQNEDVRRAYLGSAK